MKTALNSKELGEYIRKHRVRHQLNRGELAKKLDMSAQFLGRIEKGDVDIPKRALCKLIEKFSLSKRKVFEIYIKTLEIKLEENLKF